MLERQEWLTKLSFLIGTSLPPFQEESEDERDEERISPAVQFPRLPWDACAEHYQWMCVNPLPSQPISPWKGTAKDWNNLVTFLQQLRWQTSADAAVSYAELAVLFHCRGFQCETIHDNEFAAFRDLVKWMKEAIRLLQRKSTVSFVPGLHDAHLNVSWGKTMPVGALVGAQPFRNNRRELAYLTDVARRVIKGNLQTWEFLCRDFAPL